MSTKNQPPILAGKRIMAIGVLQTALDILLYVNNNVVVVLVFPFLHFT